MQNQIDIRPQIRDLLDLTEKTNQEDISKLKRFSLVFANNKVEVRKALRNRIKTWNVLLDTYYEQSKNSPELLKHLKEVALTIIKGEKTNVLRQLLSKEGYAEDASFRKAVKRTEEMLSRIINGRCFFEFSNLNFDFKTASNTSSLNKELLASVSSSEPIAISFENVFAPSDQIDVSKVLLMSRVEGMSPEKDDAWFRKLAPTLVDIEDVNQFNAVIAKLTFHQIIVLIQDYARAKNGVMILKLLKASRDDMVLEVLRSISDKDTSPINEITLINAAIDEVKDLALIQSTFGYIREIFVSKSNSFTPDMNLVAKTLRDLKEKEKITSFHTLSIESFKKPVEDLLATNVVFHKLVENRGHKLESATFHMPEKIKMTCLDRLARITNDAASRKQRDNLYSILVELAYGDTDEDDEISGALGNLGINSIEKYIELGVNVTPVPPKAANDPNASNQIQEETTKRYCQIYKYFEQMGIKTVGDLISKNIYNYEQLKKFVGSHANKPVSIPSSALKS